jgi:hypothetical protein
VERKPALVRPERQRRRVSAATGDALFLSLAVVLSFVPYVTKLGFYSDDWAFIGLYVTAPDQSLRGLYAASMSPQHAMRPVQVWLCAALYRLFGLDPLGPHLFNGALLVANAILLYAILRELRARRAIAVAVPLVYSLLPSYSTDRFWYVAFAITLSMTACLIAAYADLRAAASTIRRGVVWKVVSTAGLIVSGLAYEVALPVFLLVPLLMLGRSWRNGTIASGRRSYYIGALVAIDVAVIIGLAIFKVETTVRLGASAGIVQQVADITRHALRTNVPAGDYGLNVMSAVRVHFFDYAVGLPLTTVKLARTASTGLVALAAVVSLFVFGYLFVAVGRDAWVSSRNWAASIAAGLAVFGLGYAIFLTNYNVQFTPAGIANRSAIAAALGAALFMVGLTGWIATRILPPRGPVLFFAAVIAATSGCGVLIINILAAHWVTAYDNERAVLASIQRRLPTLPRKATLILDGVCPYVGPAIVFESNWDLAGALQVVYRDPTLAADVVTPRLTVGERSLTTRIYGNTREYAYRDDLIVYDASNGRVERLSNVDMAHAYFKGSDGGRSCPAGREGVGVPVF